MYPGLKINKIGIPRPQFDLKKWDLKGYTFHGHVLKWDLRGYTFHGHVFLMIINSISPDLWRFTIHLQCAQNTMRN